MKTILSYEFDPYEEREALQTVLNASKNELALSTIMTKMRELRKYGGTADLTIDKKGKVNVEALEQLFFHIMKEYDL